MMPGLPADLMDELIGIVCVFDLDLATRPYSHESAGSLLRVRYETAKHIANFIQRLPEMCRHMTAQRWKRAIAMETSLGCVYQARRLFESDVLCAWVSCSRDLTSEADLHNIES